MQSSASSPKAHFLHALFDAATDEFLQWSFQMPGDYASAPVLKVPFKMASATTGDVIIAVRIAAVTDADAQDVDAKAFATVNTSSATTVPGTAGHKNSISVTLSNADSVAAGDWVVLSLSRDADNASDTATGDMEVLDCMFQYTTT